MKTIEEKAKAYDKIIERAKTMLAAGEVMYGKENNASQLITDLIPELRESDDERIRKKLIGIFTNRSLCDVYNLKSEDVLAYLEKQKETPMPNSTELIEMWHKAKAILKEKDFRGDEWRLAQNAFMDGFARGTCVKFEKQKEHVPENEESDTRKEQKPVDEQFEEWLNAWYQGSKELGGNVVMSEEEFKNWSRGIKNMYDKPAEWSDEDESILEALIYDIERLPMQGVLTHRPCDSYIKFLKALRPGWKPSEEQLKELNFARLGRTPNVVHEHLDSLYNDLLKLKSL